MKNVALYLLTLFLFSCKKEGGTVNPPLPPSTLYFPPSPPGNWETATPASLGWNEQQLPALYDYLHNKGTKAFIILKDGRMVVEKYFGSFTADSMWYWASAGKTMTAMLVGIAQKEGHLQISDRSSLYLGAGWTSLPLAKEDLITIRHQLTMTTGLNDKVPDEDCTTPGCLQYQSDAGTRWAYHNAPYTLLAKVVTQATGKSFSSYFNEKLRNPLGMNGQWVTTGSNNVYYSTARSMARFGLLLLGKGKWDGASILDDGNYFEAQVTTSQNLNPSYGYLTWLNGKSNHMLAGTQILFSGPLVPQAPADMFAALGKNDQKIYVVPSQGLVIIRMGNSAGNVQLAASAFDNELWGKLKAIMQ